MGPWMDKRGNETAAGRAGLRVDEIDSVILVHYPEASRSLLGVSQVSVYLFFDADSRLLKHLVRESNLGL